MTAAAEPMGGPKVYRIEDGSQYEEYPGYIWMQLPQVLSPTDLVRGTGVTQRALVCQRCGCFVAVPSTHDTACSGSA